MNWNEKKYIQNSAQRGKDPKSDTLRDMEAGVSSMQSSRRYNR